MECLKNNWLYTIRSVGTVYDRETFTKADKEINQKYKKDRQNLEFLKFHIEHIFTGVDKIKINNIIACGYDDYAYRVEFTYNKSEYAISFPIRKNLTIDNIDYASEGKFELLKKTGKSSWTIVESSYRETDIKKYFEENFLSSNE